MIDLGMLEHSTVRTGYWCPTCALPSAVEVDVLLVNDEGVTGTGLGRIRVCPTCRGEDFDDPRD